MSEQTVCFIGGGNMARSLIGGLVADGRRPESIRVADPEAGQRQALSDAFGIVASADNAAAAAAADIVVIAVKPQVLAAVTREVAQADNAESRLYISIAAGIREPDIRRWLGGEPAIVRAMPNTPALLGSGVTALYANDHTVTAQREAAESILRAVGAVVWLDDETLMDAVTAISGSGPAYFFLFMEIIAATAVELGLSDDVARLITVETALGAARMALETSDDLASLRRHVTSPGGTTAAALAELDSDELRAVIVRAIHSARRRAGELADEFGRD